MSKYFAASRARSGGATRALPGVRVAVVAVMPASVLDAAGSAFSATWLAELHSCDGEGDEGRSGVVPSHDGFAGLRQAASVSLPGNGRGGIVGEQVGDGEVVALELGTTIGGATSCAVAT